ncbi:Tyrosine recombinase XerC [Mycobacteroides abscessus subsp. abscessus]|nr:Tyrosine recombinase XerC [Mycobacteroides abscessus subsp. abscessus]
MSKYYYSYCPDGIKSRYELLVFDRKEQPFLPLTEHYHDCLGRISKSSALSYLQCLLPFFDWLDVSSNYQSKRVKWNDSPIKIRVAIEDYLKIKMACKVREKETFRFVKLTIKSPNTVNRFLSAIKSFYKTLIRLNMYKHNNPLIDSKEILSEFRNQLEGVRKQKPRMPTIGGTEEPLEHRRLTDSYFKIINEEWQPQIIDDPHLPFQIYQAGKKVSWSQRETIISRMLFETGGRASEIIELTIGDYRSRKNLQEVITFNKGSHGKKVKFLRFSKETVKRLLNYINTERRQYDPSDLGFKNLPDEAPIFLTVYGTPLTYPAWYYHWNKAIKNSGIKINPHKARHWFVTTRLREIYNISKNEKEIDQRKHELIRYMKWNNPETIKTYEHHFDEEKHRKAHDQMLDAMAKNEIEYDREQNIKSMKKTKLTVIENRKELDIHEDLRELLEGLE